VELNPYVLSGNYNLQQWVVDLIQQNHFDVIIETGNHQERLIPFLLNWV